MFPHSHITFPPKPPRSSILKTTAFLRHQTYTGCQIQWLLLNPHTPLHHFYRHYYPVILKALFLRSTKHVFGSLLSLFLELPVLHQPPSVKVLALLTPNRPPLQHTLPQFELHLYPWFDWHTRIFRFLLDTYRVTNVVTYRQDNILWTELEYILPIFFHNLTPWCGGAGGGRRAGQVISLIKYLFLLFLS